MGAVLVYFRLSNSLLAQAALARLWPNIRAAPRLWDLGEGTVTVLSGNV